MPRGQPVHELLQLRRVARRPAQHARRGWAAGLRRCAGGRGQTLVGAVARGARHRGAARSRKRGAQGVVPSRLPEILRDVLPGGVRPRMVGRPPPRHREDTEVRSQGRPLRAGDVPWFGQVLAHRDRRDLGDALRSPRVRRGRGRVRVRRAGDPRLDQDRAGGERASRRRLPGGVLPDHVPRRHRQQVRWAALQGRTHTHHVDGERDSPADDTRGRLVGRTRPGRRHHGTHSRHEVQEAGRTDDPPGVRRDRRSADERVGGIAGADTQARPRPRGRHPRPRGTGQEDIGNHALHGDPPRRHGRADPRQVEASRMERGAVQDALPDADERGAVEPLRRPPRRRAAGERHVRGGDRVLPPAPRGDGRGGEGVVARPPQLRRDQRDPARDEPQAHRRGGVLGGVPERPAAGGLGDGRTAHRGRDRQQAQRTLPERDPRLGDARHDVHRRAEDAPLLRRVRVERRFLRDRR